MDNVETINVGSIIVEDTVRSITFKTDDDAETTVRYKRLTGLEMLNYTSSSAKISRTGQISFSPDSMKQLLTRKIVSVGENESKDVFLSRASSEVLDTLYNLITTGRTGAADDPKEI